MIATSAQPDALLRRMGTLADATRLRLLCLLERQELGVSDLCEILQTPQSTVSRHLRVLADERWVTSRRQGTTNLYHMPLDELEPQQVALWELARQQAEGWATLAQDRVRLANRLSSRKRDTQSFFAGAAEAWDRTRQELYGSRFSTEAMLALLPADWVVADLGCGTGATAAALSAHVARVIGVDSSEAMLAAAKQQTAGLANVELRRGEVEAVPIDDAACDAALLVLVLAYAPEPAAVLAEARRVLRPGGRLVLIDLLAHDREDFRRQMGQQNTGFAPGELGRLLKAAGFSGVSCGPLTPEPEARGPALLLARADRPPAPASAPAVHTPALKSSGAQTND